MADLLPQDLLDPLRDVVLAAASGPGGEQPPAIAKIQVDLDRFAGEFGDGHAAPRSLVPKPRVEVVRELHRRPPHGMPAYHICFTRAMIVQRYPKVPQGELARLQPTEFADLPVALAS